jgi:hypothetical protein
MVAEPRRVSAHSFDPTATQITQISQIPQMEKRPTVASLSHLRPSE